MKRGKPSGWQVAACLIFFSSWSLWAVGPAEEKIFPAFWDAEEALTLPGWFGPVQTAAGASMTVWRAPVRPPPGSARLAATFWFEENQGGFARLIWQGPNRAVTICGNLYEGASLWHSRTFLLDRDMMAGAGQLILEATGERPVLKRAELSWVEPLVLAASGGVLPGVYLTSSGKIFPSDELLGQGRRAPQDERRDRMIDAVLDAGPVKVQPEAPVRFVVPMAAHPSHARLEAQVAGLGPGEEPVLSINGRPLAAVAVELPDLEDGGYRWIPGGRDFSFGGWRTLTAHVPPGWLAAGENQLDWQCPAGSLGMTVRHLRMQVGYDRSVPITPASAPVVAGAAAPPAGLAAASAVVPNWPAASPAVPKLRVGLSSASGGVTLRPE